MDPLHILSFGIFGCVFKIHFWNLLQKMYIFFIFVILPQLGFWYFGGHFVFWQVGLSTGLSSKRWTLYWPLLQTLYSLLASPPAGFYRLLLTGGLNCWLLTTEDSVKVPPAFSRARPQVTNTDWRHLKSTSCNSECQVTVSASSLRTCTHSLSPSLFPSIASSSCLKLWEMESSWL